MSNLGSSYTKILALLHELENRDNYLSQIRTPKLSDKQLIALVFAAESLGLDSERHLFRQLPNALDGLIDRSVFNRRRRQLAVHIGRFRQCLPNDLAPAEDTCFVDSMPLEACKLGPRQAPAYLPGTRGDPPGLRLLRGSQDLLLRL